MARARVGVATCVRRAVGGSRRGACRARDDRERACPSRDDPPPQRAECITATNRSEEVDRLVDVAEPLVANILHRRLERRSSLRLLEEDLEALLGFLQRRARLRLV